MTAGNEDPRFDDSTETELRTPAEATRTSGPSRTGSPAEEPTIASGGAGSALPDLGLVTVPREQYLVEGEIARGGMGRVLAARDRRLGRPVALKELLSSSPELAKRFEREALMTARLQHPSIVNVHEAGRWPSGEPFYAMKRVVGRPLDKVVRDAGSVEERLALLPKVLAVSEALAYAHEQGVIHRDLKPANVLVGSFGETVVVDWGLAKDLLRAGAFEGADGSGGRPPSNEDSGASQATPDALTMVGTVLGTPSYMAPEQARGEALDERADVYALGAILYTVLAGAPPYVGPSSTVVLAEVLKGPPVPLEARQPGLPEDLLAIVRKAMSVDRDHRYRTAGEFSEDLRRYQTGQLVGAHRYGAGELVRRWVRKHRGAVAVASIAVFALALGTTAAFLRVRAERDVAQARSDELVLSHARSAVETDPTEAIAWLKQYSLTAPDWSAARIIAADARSRGIAGRVLLGHEHSVNWIVFSPDGRFLASSSGDQSVRLWDLTSGASRTLGTFDWFAYALAFSPNGRYVAGSSNLHLRLWDLNTGQSRDFPGQPRGLAFHDKDIAFSPDGRQLASVGVERPFHGAGAGRVTLRLIDVTTGRIRLIEGRGSPRRLRRGDDLWALNSFGDFRLAFSPDGRFVAARIEERRVRIWDLASESVRDLPAKRGLAFAPAGNLLAVGAENNLVRLFDLGSGRQQLLKGHTAPVLDVALSPRGFVASASEDGQIRLWDSATGASRGFRRRQDAAHLIRFSPDGRWLAAAGGDDPTLSLWEIETGQERALRGHRGDVLSIAFAPDGRQIATSSVDRSIRIWQVEPEDVRPLAAPEPGNHAKAFSPDGRLLADALNGGPIRLLRLADGDARSLGGHRGGIRQLAFSPDGQTLAAAGDDHSVRVWDVASGQSRIVHTHGAPAVSVAFSPDGRLLASGGRDGLVALTEVTAGTKRLLAGHTFTAATVLFSPDGRWVASAADPQKADSGLKDAVGWLWDTASGQPRLLAGHTDTVCGIAFSPNGRMVATASMDKTVGLWDLQTGGRRMLVGHGSIVRDVGFSPDGRTLASAGEDTTVRLWDVETGTSRSLHGHRSPVIRVRFTPDGTTVITNAWDGTLRLWDVVSGQGRSVVEVARDIAISPNGLELATTGEDGQVRIWRDDLPHDPTALHAWLLRQTDSTVAATPSR